MDFYPPNRNSVSAFRWRHINRILSRWARAFKCWSIIAALALPLSLTTLHS